MNLYMKCIECGEELLEDKEVCINCGCPKSYTIKKFDEIKLLEETEKRREENRKRLEELKRIEEEEKEKIEILKQEEKIRIQREKEEERRKKEFKKEEAERRKRIEELKNIQYKIKNGEVENIKDELENEKKEITENEIEQPKKTTQGKRKLGSLKYNYNEKIENNSIQIIGSIIGVFDIIVGFISFLLAIDSYEGEQFIGAIYSSVLIFLGVATIIVFKAFGDLVTSNKKQVALLEELLKETLKK